ncbi:MAG: hypothetical protein IKV00_07460 [Clostridia bacterium]|nr:hypothetical protein [Clostridia bacterium]
MAELERCPVCGKAATVIHMNDTYDRADYGWYAGCAAAKDGDGIHADLDLVRVVGMPSEDVAVKVWNNKAKKVRAQKELEKAWRHCRKRFWRR